MIRNFSLSVVLMIMIASNLPCLADVVLSTGFEVADGYPAAVSNLPTTSTLPVYAQNVDASIIREIREEGNPFGTGQYLALGGANLRVRSNGVTPLTTVSFDLFEPSGSTGLTRMGFGNADLNSNTTTGAYIGWTINNGVMGLANNTSIASGSLPTLSLDTQYRAHFFLNRSGSSQSVQYGNQTLDLADGQAGLLFFDYGTSSFVGASVFNHTQSVNPTTFFFRSFSSEGNLIFIDNFSRNSTLVAIPEPSSMVVFGFLAGSFLAGRPRRN